MMNRREWLTKVLGAIVAATVAPLLDLTDQTPAFWNQAPLKKLLRWQIRLPDGVTYTFNATVIAEHLIDDVVSLTVRPSGPMQVEQTTVSFPTTYVEPDPVESVALPARSSFDTVLSTVDGRTATIQEIGVSALSRANEELDNYVLGNLKQLSGISFKMKFMPD